MVLSRKEAHEYIKKKYPDISLKTIDSLYYRFNKDIKSIEIYIVKSAKERYVSDRLKHLSEKYHVGKSHMKRLLYKIYKVDSFLDISEQDLENLDKYCEENNVGVRGTLSIHVKEYCNKTGLEYKRIYRAVKNYLRDKNVSSLELKNKDDLKIIDHYLENEYLKIRFRSHFKFKFNERLKFRNFTEFYESLNTPIPIMTVRKLYFKAKTKEEFLNALKEVSKKREDTEFVRIKITEIANKHNKSYHSIYANYIEQYFGLRMPDLIENPELLEIVDKVVEYKKRK